MREIDIHIVDRLVDGELTDDERRSLLVACEQNPDHWRQVALAFVESQALSEDLKFAANPVEVVSNRPNSKRTHFFNARMQNAFGVVAAVLLAVGLGFGVGSISNAWQSDPSGDSVVSRTDQDPDATNQRPTDPASHPDSLYMLVRDQDDGGLRPLEIPIDGSVGDGFPSDYPASSVPVEWIHQLEQAGHNVQQTTRYHTLQMNGRTVVVPIDGVRINFQKYQ